MYYESNFSTQSSQEAMFSNDNQQLQAQVAQLMEWKHEAKVQLEHFRTACSIYNFCDSRAVHELLSK